MKTQCNAMQQCTLTMYTLCSPLFFRSEGNLPISSRHTNKNNKKICSIRFTRIPNIENKRTKNFYDRNFVYTNIIDDETDYTRELASLLFIYDYIIIKAIGMLVTKCTYIFAVSHSMSNKHNRLANFCVHIYNLKSHFRKRNLLTTSICPMYTKCHQINGGF